MPLFATSDVREISPRGEVVKITRLEGTPFTTLALANGNHWVACGDGHSLMEVNLDNGEVARRYGENDIKEPACSSSPACFLQGWRPGRLQLAGT